MRKGCALSCLWLISAALADEGDIRLKEGPGRELVAARCSLCHSLDYIQVNSVFLDRQGWKKSVDKMIKAMGAPIKQEEIGPIVAYLTRYYGKE